MSNQLELADVSWRRVSPKLVWVELTGAIIVLIVMLAICTGLWLMQLWVPLMIVGVFVVGSIVQLVIIPRRVRSIGYQLRDDDLLFRRGIMWQRFVAVPYGRMQLIDINRGPIARALGLSELKFVTAAAAAGVTLPGLLAADADELRDRLVALAESRRAGL